MTAIRERAIEDNANFLLGLYRTALGLPQQELYKYFLDHAVKITESKIGFFHLVGTDQRTIMLTTWNQEALKSCTTPDETHYPIEKAGNWADCVRLKKPIIYNNFETSPNQKGLPKGHLQVTRMLTLPIINDNEVFAIFGVGNASSDYKRTDVRKLELVANELNKILLQRRTEQKLRGSEEKFRQLALHSPDTVYVLDLIAHKADFINCHSFLGYSLEELQDKGSILSSIHPYDKPTVMKNWQYVIKGEPEGEKSIEYRLKSKSGDWEWIQSRATTLRRDERGLPIQVLVNLTVITERKKIEEELSLSEERFYKAFNANPAAISISRLADGLLVDVNETYLQLFEFDRQQVIGHTSTELGIFIGPDERSKLTSLLQIKGRLRNLETTFVTKSGKHIQVLISMDKINVRNIDYIISTVADVTERKKLENKLQNYTRDLEKLVETRTNQLKESERLAAIGTTAAMVGHDIRNPLQAMISDVFLLKDTLHSMHECESKEQVKESLQGIEDNILYVNKIVADLQDFARPLIPQLSEVNLYQLVTDIFGPFSLGDNIHPIIEIDCSLILRTDPTLLRRALYNLITNAVQAMPEGGILNLIAHRNNSGVCIIVADTGVGIPEEVKPKLFTPMFTTKSKGQGFGLAVVKRLVEALSGTITFESKVGSGTKFTIDLPITP